MKTPFTKPLRTAILAACLLYTALPAQTEFPHTELEWSTIPTEHFLVHFHQGTERFARRTADFLESLHPRLVDLYAYEPDRKISFILRDHDDYSNGAAYFYDNKVEIWVPSLDFDLRGTHPWLENVLTHELTHIFQMQVSMKWTRRVPAVYLQWLGYESERRPDVLYGYPNILASYPLSGFAVPAWFAEGTAQYNHPDLKYDTWDSHRDMILRMHILEGSPLTWEEMAVFGKTSLGNESSYNAGYSIVEYVARTYGDSAVIRVARSLGAIHRADIGGAIQDVLNKSGEELYTEWLEAKRIEYEKVREGVAPGRTEGTLIESEGFANAHPVFSGNGGRVYYVSNRGEDYTSLSSLVEYDRDTRRSRVVVPKMRSTISLSPDGRYVYYARVSRANPHWSLVSDLYRYDVKEEEETRLTHGWRAVSPRVSANGGRIVFGVLSGGTMNVGVAEVKDLVDGGDSHRSGRSKPRLITEFERDEQVFTPVWSGDGATIAFGFSRGHNQTIAFVDSGGENLRLFDPVSARFERAGPDPATDGWSDRLPTDARHPFFSPDGKWMYFSWNDGGIFDIHRVPVSGGQVQQVTQVLGGAFYPCVSPGGETVFARYDATGYKIALVDPPVFTPGKVVFREHSGSKESAHVLPQDTGDLSKAEPDSMPGTRPYRSVFSTISLYPLVRVDNYNPSNKGIDVVKPGLYFTSNEVLDKVGLFGGAAINRNLERDVFLIFQYKDAIPLLSKIPLEPTLSLELYNISRATETSFDLFVDRLYTIPIDVTYNLIEFDASLTQPILSEQALVTLGYTRSRYSADLGSFLIPTVGVSPSFRNVYLLGNGFWLEGRLRAIHPTVDEAINPVGRTARFRATYESHQYNRDLEYNVVNGLLVPLYKDFRFFRLEGSWNEHLRLPFSRHTLTVGIRGGAITGGSADTIFHFYGGGMIGLKGYPFYSLEGTNFGIGYVSYRFPLIQKMDVRLLHITFTKLYASVFAEAGDAWTGGWKRFAAKKDVGAELRLESFSFYAYPTRFSFSAAYGLNGFRRQVQGLDISYGREWKFYFNILFDFDVNEITGRGLNGRTFRRGSVW